MSNDIKQINDEIRNLGKVQESVPVGESGGGILLIMSLAKGMKSALDSCDKFLVANGVDLKQFGARVASVGRTGLESVKDLSNKTGLTSTAAKFIVKGDEVSSDLADKYRSYDNNVMGPPREGETLVDSSTTGKLGRMLTDVKAKVVSKVNDTLDEQLPETKKDSPQTLMDRFKSTTFGQRLATKTTETPETLDKVSPLPNTAKEQPLVNENDEIKLADEEVKEKETFFDNLNERITGKVKGEESVKETKKKSGSPIFDMLESGVTEATKLTTMSTIELSMFIAKNLEKSTRWIFKNSAKLAWSVAKWSSAKLLGGIGGAIKGLGGMLYKGLNFLSVGLLGKAKDKVVGLGKSGISLMSGAKDSFVSSFKNTVLTKKNPQEEGESEEAYAHRLNDLKEEANSESPVSLVDKLNPLNTLKKKVTKSKEEESYKEESEETKKPNFLKTLTNKLTGTDEKEWVNNNSEFEKENEDEVEAEKKAVKERIDAKKKKDEKDGWLNKIIGSVMKVGPFLLGGLKMVFTTGLGKLLKGMLSMGKGLVTGIGKGIWKFAGPALKGLATTIISGMSNAINGLGGMLSKILPSPGGVVNKVGGFLKNMGSKALDSLKSVGVRSIASKVGGFVARTALAVSGPVGWAIAGAVAVGTAAYAGYKLYKYLKRNDLREDIYGKLTRLRLLTYGVNETNKDYFSKMFDIEMELKDNLVSMDKDGGSYYTLKPITPEFTTKVIEIMGIDRDDQDKATQLNNWFSNRFIPAYLAFVNALKKANPKAYMDDIEVLDQKGLEQFLMSYTIPTQVYKVTEIPLQENEEIVVTPEEVQEQYNDIKKDVLEKSKTPTDLTNKLTVKTKKENKPSKKVAVSTPSINPKQITPPEVKDVSTIDVEAEREALIERVKENRKKLAVKVEEKLDPTVDKFAASIDSDGKYISRTEKLKKARANGEVTSKALQKLIASKPKLMVGNSSPINKVNSTATVTPTSVFEEVVKESKPQTFAEKIRGKVLVDNKPKPIVEAPVTLSNESSVKAPMVSAKFARRALEANPATIQQNPYNNVEVGAATVTNRYPSEVASQSSPSLAMSPVLNTDGIEDLLGKQVSLLTKVTDILSSMNDKLPKPEKPSRIPPNRGNYDASKGKGKSSNTVDGEDVAEPISGVGSGASRALKPIPDSAVSLSRTSYK